MCLSKPTKERISDEHNNTRNDRKTQGRGRFSNGPAHARFGGPQRTQTPVVYQLAEKTQAVAHGGLALIHQIVLRTGLYDALNSVSVLKVHLPYTEADHVLNIAYDFFCGGTALEYIEYRRQDPVHLDMLGAHSIPDPTTAGDFCRRYSPEQIDALHEAINETRLNVWALQCRLFFDEAVVDPDGDLPSRREWIAPTNGEHKQGMDISYKGQWGYHREHSPLWGGLCSLAFRRNSIFFNVLPSVRLVKTS